jgi:hypothetical protein
MHDMGEGIDGREMVPQYFTEETRREWLETAFQQHNTSHTHRIAYTDTSWCRSSSLIRLAANYLADYPPSYSLIERKGGVAGGAPSRGTVIAFGRVLAWLLALWSY